MVSNDHIEYAAILQQWEKGQEVDSADLINALAWNRQNQRRALARLEKACKTWREGYEFQKAKGDRLDQLYDPAIKRIAHLEAALKDARYLLDYTVTLDGPDDVGEFFDRVTDRIDELLPGNDSTLRATTDGDELSETQDALHDTCQRLCDAQDRIAQLEQIQRSDGEVRRALDAKLAQLEAALRQIAMFGAPDIPYGDTWQGDFENMRDIARGAIGYEAETPEPTGMEIAQREAEEAAGDNDPRDRPIDFAREPQGNDNG
jgi:hypothetical protein